MDRYRVPPDTRVFLAERDPSERLTFDGDKEVGREHLRRLTTRLGDLQELLYAEGKNRILIVLQATDTGGKDGVIRRVFSAINPQGVTVSNFKAPSDSELAHDYLWRVHQVTPARGEIRIFNRSHYEDVLVVRVRNLVPKEVWERRYQHINDFERMLADEGTTIIKFFLHISKAEQATRFQDRLDDPTKLWKFNPRDLTERERWDAYQEAYETMLSLTSTTWAPWYVVPANSKWYRDLVVARVLVETLERLGMRYPEPNFDPTEIRID
jgi:PPK2 family polyphosphate:nucleotide phosphotransferase